MALQSELAAVRAFRACIVASMLLVGARSQRLTDHYDVVNPIITEGPENSLYGYSVSLHVNGQQKFAVAGAPHADASIPTSGVTRPGAVYRCTLQAQSVGHGPCRQINIDSAPNGRWRNGTRRETKSNMRLGASVMSEGVNGKLVACAPSYKTPFMHPRNGWLGFEFPHKTKVYENGALIDDAIGRCYVLPSSLGTSDITVLTPCNKIPSYSNVQTVWNTWLRYCMIGTSVDIAKNSNNQNILAMGAPGRQLGAGQFWKANLDSARTQPLGSGIFEKRNLNRYAGMTVAQADFNGDNRMDVALGQPLFGPKKQGGVLIIPDEATRPPGEAWKVIQNMSYVQLSGQYTGENFGYSIIAVNIDGDPVPELIVGAPLARAMSISHSTYETGHVYIFSGRQMKRQVEAGSPMVVPVQVSASEAEITLRGEAQAWFGAALAPVYDINGDSFNDIAVGAPYEMVNDIPQGAVYIYLGSQNGIVEQYIQRISAEELGTSRVFHGFGFSLGRGMDFDGNKYNDLIVGSPFTNEAVVLRARPTITPNFTLVGVTQSAVDCIVNGHTVRCVKVQLCGMVHSGHLIHGRATYDVDLTTPGTLSFDPANSFIDEFTTQIVLRRSRTCETISMYLTSNMATCASTEVQLVSWRLVPEESTVRELTAVENTPPPPPRVQTLPVALVKRCTSCRAQLNVDEVFLTGLNQESELVIGRNRQLLLSASITNVGTEVVCTGRVTVFLGDHLSYSHLQRAVGRQCTQDDTGERTVTCQLPPGQALNAPTTITFVVNVPADLHYNVTSITASVAAVPNASQAPNKATAVPQSIQVVRHAAIEVNAVPTSTQLELSKEVPPKATLEQLGPELKHDFRVNNVGPSQVPPSVVSIEWPSYLRSGSDFLYLTSVESSDALTRCNASRVINYLKKNTTLKAKRNVRDFNSNPAALSDFEAKVCARTGPVCYISIQCLVPEMVAGASTLISLTWRVYSGINENMRLEYPIKANTTIRLLDIMPAAGFTEDDSRKPSSGATTELYAVFETVSEGVKWWIILLAVLAGVFILLLCIVLLCKCGFFKRKRSPDNE